MLNFLHSENLSYRLIFVSNNKSYIVTKSKLSQKVKALSAGVGLPPQNFRSRKNHPLGIGINLTTMYYLLHFNRAKVSIYVVLFL